jgi:serine/threonine-protein kinase
MGVIMYHMFTGQLPFTSKDAAELARDHQTKQPQAPRELNPKIPAPLNEIMLKVLAKEPSGRYRTADQLGRVLLTFATPSDGAEAEAFAPVKRGTGEQARGAKTGPSKAVKAAKATAAPETDWVAVGLGLLAALLVGGLLPFWMWVYLVYNPPIR